MTAKQLIEWLKQYPEDAEINVIEINSNNDLGYNWNCFAEDLIFQAKDGGIYFGGEE